MPIDCFLQKYIHLSLENENKTPVIVIYTKFPFAGNISFLSNFLQLSKSCKLQVYWYNDL